MGKNKIDITSLIGYIAILVIIISLANIGIRLTGRVVDTGVVNVTIESRTNINFTTDFINFGSGQVDPEQTSETLTTVGGGTTGGTGNWSGTGDNFIIENIGNVNVTLQLYSGKDADDFLGGTSPVYQYNVSNNEANSCTESNATLGAWEDVNKTSPGTIICDPLDFEDSRDLITIDIKLTIPSDANPGEQTDTFTATATAA